MLLFTMTKTYSVQNIFWKGYFFKIYLTICIWRHIPSLNMSSDDLTGIILISNFTSP